ncbi:MAG: hypothetical protein RSC95_01205 [Anaerovoracaceae bacterium]
MKKFNSQYAIGIAILLLCVTLIGFRVYNYLTEGLMTTEEIVASVEKTEIILDTYQSESYFVLLTAPNKPVKEVNVEIYSSVRFNRYIWFNDADNSSKIFNHCLYISGNNALDITYGTKVKGAKGADINFNTGRHRVDLREKDAYMLVREYPWDTTNPVWVESIYFYNKWLEIIEEYVVESMW